VEVDLSVSEVRSDRSDWVNYVGLDGHLFAEPIQRKLSDVHFDLTHEAIGNSDEVYKWIESCSSSQGELVVDRLWTSR